METQEEFKKEHPITDDRPAVRVHKSILHKAEKRVLIWMAGRLPGWMNSDHLTAIGLAGGIITAMGYVLSNRGMGYLWLASCGLAVNWFGDSLDGTLARVRNTQRHIYGFYIDHNVDALTIIVICVGAGLSPLVSFSVAMLVLVCYLLMSIFTYINTYLKGEFRLSYGRLGPTEFRIIVIFINTFFICFPFGDHLFSFMGITLKVIDPAGIGIALILVVIYLVSFAADLRKFGKIDPPHPCCTGSQ